MAYNKVVLGDGTVLVDLTGDDVSPADVAQGKIFHKRDGTVGTGTNTYDADTSDATATASEILEGKTAYKNGQKITGTMVNRGAQTGYISHLDNPVQIQVGYHDGSGTVGVDATEKAKIIPANIKRGVTVLGVVGDYSGDSIDVQSKNVTPYLTAQTVLPDSGYDYLSQVNVAPITITETDNAAGGKTITIGAVAPS